MADSFPHEKQIEVVPINGKSARQIQKLQEKFNSFIEAAQGRDGFIPSTDQIRFIKSLIGTRDIKEACLDAKVSYPTAQKWIEHNGFKLYIQDLLKHLRLLHGGKFLRDFEKLYNRMIAMAMGQAKDVKQSQVHSAAFIFKFLKEVLLEEKKREDAQPVNLVFVQKGDLQQARDEFETASLSDAGGKQPQEIRLIDGGPQIRENGIGDLQDIDCLPEA